MIRRAFLFVFLATLVLSTTAQNSIRSKADVQLYKLSVAARTIGAYYVDTVDKEEIVEGAIKAMLEDLDPHSVYMNREEVKRMNEPLRGNFEGIGIQFNILDDTLMVVNPIPGGPSEKVGILAGDRIIYIDDDMVAGIGITNKDVTDRLRGDKGTEVTVKIKRNGTKKLLEFTIVRDKIPLHSLDAAYMVNDDIGYIKLNRFSGTTLDEFSTALNDLKKDGMKSLILDLQGNGGGYLNAATGLADEFLSNNKLIVYTEGLNSPRQTFRATKGGKFEKGELVVLIDESSASASEILSGAIQDWDRGLIVGRRSFGKGLVQRQFNLPDGSAMRLTTAKYYTPSGRLIQKPYNHGRAEYRKEIINRYNNGELLSEDSIHFPDSLKYKTLVLNRIVYGGGGIMPDVFVPIDTSVITDYHRSLVAKGVMNKTVLNYVDKHRQELNSLYPDFAMFDTKFFVTQDMLDELIANGEKAKLEYNDEQFKHSLPLISAQFKALVARDIFDISEYYQVMNEQDDIFQKAVEILSNSGMLEQKLSEK
ncbi:S41 family peptidase [Saccharicrinis sp. FJH2]|uniref:S41 family peptidase n=1 Tax=Saccharicrinis sp. FJH65 TaxID=3344659 RepID=UPI0035F31F36